MTEQLCEYENCQNKACAHGMCRKHYMRWYRHGNALSTERPFLGDIELRFLSKVDPFGPIAKNNPELGSCYLWTGHCKREGYGIFGHDGKQSVAHRWAYKYWIDPTLPDNRELDHFACDNPNCVNLTHVRPVTTRENILRGNNPAAQNLAKTHCSRGHEYTPENTQTRKRGHRRCRICTRISQRESQRRRADFCPAGHSYSAGNLLLGPRGKKLCKACGDSLD